MWRYGHYRNGTNGTVKVLLARAAEAHHAVFSGKQSIVRALADIQTGQILGASLAQDDLPGCNRLAVLNLNSQPLGLGVPP